MYVYAKNPDVPHHILVELLQSPQRESRISGVHGLLRTRGGVALVLQVLVMLVNLETRLMKLEDDVLVARRRPERSQ